MQEWKKKKRLRILEALMMWNTLVIHVRSWHEKVQASAAHTTWLDKFSQLNLTGEPAGCFCLAPGDDATTMSLSLSLSEAAYSYVNILLLTAEVTELFTSEKIL